MIVPIVVGAGALYGWLRYKKKQLLGAVPTGQGEPATRTAPAPDGQGAPVTFVGYASPVSRQASLEKFNLMKGR
jgi:hypothetical protein